MAIAGLVATGCAGNSGSPGGSPPPATRSASHSTSPTGPATLTVTGQVEHVDVEGGCLVLRTEDRTFQLLGGDPAIITPGARVTVTGTVRTDIATICQLGAVLDVTSARPA
jgi:hypothetical protein